MDAIFAIILKFLSDAQVAAPTVALILEFVLRLIPSQKPLSILHIIARVVRVVSNILEKLADLLDLILPQKQVQPPVEPPKA